MTPKKIKRFAPYTINMAVSGLSGFTEPLAAVFSSYFKNKDAWPKISDHIHEAMAAYGLDMQTNQLRKITSEQRIDRYELIACIKEVRNRIDPLYIPPPVLNTARDAYRPRKESKPTLDEELRDLLSRMHHLQQLFEHTDIPTPKETNPGKPERTRLEAKIADIYDAFAKDSNIEKDARKDVKGHFVRDVSIVFNLREKPDKNQGNHLIQTIKTSP